ncbi:uncharacterized protein PFLUO_LOCUS2142 [Penicillium psychrofluorescens]|uniref:uncharacterized protein n=1 Tax=Penicillium psychrofluorescens TaxID=3158075 RepID=UPI003CCCA808
MSNPPQHTPTGPKILRPDIAKALSRNQKPSSASTIPEQPPTTSPYHASDPVGPTLSRRTWLSTFTSKFTANLRTRYAALPHPIRRSMRVARVLAPLLPISLWVSEHVYQVMWVRGPSMTPYLNENYEEMNTASDMVLVNMWPWEKIWPGQTSRRLERGMVVTFRSPANQHHIAIKRIIGLPGDRITTREPCPKLSQIVPFNHVWLEGDAVDPRKSLDSNTYGPVSVSLITGRVMAVLGPSNRRRWLDWEGWEDGRVDGAEPDDVFGKNYREEVRGRVGKGAVKIERPPLG